MAGKASISTTRYSNFRGVDFSTDASLVSAYRSPWAVNMIADTGGVPEKRPGYRTVFQKSGTVHGIWYLEAATGFYMIAHVGTDIYSWTDDTDIRKINSADISDHDSTGVIMDNVLYIVTGGEYLQCDGNSCIPVVGYIPTTIIARSPTGGGVTFESVNLVSTWQRNEFICDGTSKIYQLSSENIGSDVTVKFRGEIMSSSKYTVNTVAGTVKFTTAPEAPAAGQEGELIITFDTQSGGRAKIAGCTIMTTYGVGTNDRIIFSGNPLYKNIDWMCGVSDPTYIPDLSYAVIGSEQTAIVGYRRINAYQAIIKEDDGHDTTIFFRHTDTDSDGNVVFPIQQTIAGIGGVSIHGVGNINDDQLFLSRNGVFALTTNLLTAERVAQNRSFYVDRLLTAEPDLDKAVCESWNGMFLVCVNSHVYLLDGRQTKTYRQRNTSEYVYECYYWEDLPIHTLCSVKMGADEELWFGTDDGKICKLNTDLTKMERFSDDGDAIRAIWACKSDDDGDANILKTMIKKGNSVTLKPYTRSSAKICFRTDNDAVDRQVRYDTADIFDWTDIDFRRLTFNSNDGPQEIMFNNKVKKYKRLQIIIKNDANEEGFGIFAITKHYVSGNFAKR